MRLPFSVNVGADQRNSEQYAVQISQSGLGMPDRDYYLRNDERFAATRKAYATYISRLFALGNQPDPEGAAARITALETTIAKLQWDRARNRDRNATYNKMGVEYAAGVDAALRLAGVLRGDAGRREGQGQAKSSSASRTT